MRSTKGQPRVDIGQHMACAWMWACVTKAYLTEHCPKVFLTSKNKSIEVKALEVSLSKLWIIQSRLTYIN